MASSPGSVCGACGAPSAEGSRFCPQCGAPSISTGFTNFTRVRELFDQALRQPAASREQWLAEACHGDAALLAEVRAMLLPVEDSFLARPAAAFGAGSPPGEQTSGEFIGPYRIVREIGRGGMGVVYLAMRDDGTFRKNVALKLLLREQVNPEFVQRFKQERQVVAALDHPNIARILDGGDAPDGMPFYVMEYVEGLPLDRYCDQQRLTLNARIALFQQVCYAVHYLHQNLIVHRDLKPSNILVTADGVVKLLDFGIAKVVGAASLSSQELTSAQLRPMTPIYASPEQMQGATLQKTSDIYSLGAILYRLLTGRLPYENIDEKIQKLAAREDPPPPSGNVREDAKSQPDSAAHRKRALTGALDSIVLMAMKYDPKKRYQSALDLSADLQRYLDGEALTAYHEPVAVRSMKLLKRKRLAIAVLAAFACLAAFGARQWERAEQQKAEADRRQTQLRGVLEQLEIRVATAGTAPTASASVNDVRRLKRAFATEYTAAVAAHPGVTPEREALLNRGVQYLDRIRDLSPATAALDLELADAYQQLAVLRENTSPDSERRLAVDLYRKAADVLTNISAADPENALARARLDVLRRRIVELAGSVPPLPAAPGGEAAGASAQMPASPTPPRMTARPAQSNTAAFTPQRAESGETAAPQTVPVAPVAALLLSPAVRRELEDILMNARAKVETADQLAEPTRRGLEAQGHTLNASVLSAQSNMHQRLDRASREFADGHEAETRDDAAAASAYAQQVMHAFGR